MCGLEKPSVGMKVESDCRVGKNTSFFLQLLLGTAGKNITFSSAFAWQELCGGDRKRPMTLPDFYLAGA